MSWMNLSDNPWVLMLLEKLYYPVLGVSRDYYNRPWGVTQTHCPYLIQQYLCQGSYKYCCLTVTGSHNHLPCQRKLIPVCFRRCLNTALCGIIWVTGGGYTENSYSFTLPETAYLWNGCLDKCIGTFWGGSRDNSLVCDWLCLMNSVNIVSENKLAYNDM